MRGAALLAELRRVVRGGRSPRARGSLQGVCHYGQLQRSIPACAGQPLRICMGRCSKRVDPRVRGAATGHSWAKDLGTGRSPRARGSPHLPDPCPQTERSIPACAGQPAGKSCATRSRRVDPRVRGAATECRLHDRGPKGRSPRARGSLRLSKGSPSLPGSIPACAGQPHSLSLYLMVCRVDPRVRGAAALAAFIFG